jgi:hypothetical protein
MRSSEFRLGNLLQATARGGYKVFEPIDSGLMQIIISLAGAEAIHGENVFLNFTWQPVPLDAEWLERLGFEPDQQGWKIKISEQAFIWRGNFEQVVRFCSSEIDYSYPIHLVAPVYHLQYVHQLQNLYFALTGEELKIDAGCPHIS